ncbi:hypothetical protein ACJJTC_019024, partial [Scirpophaga incertulas]
MSCSITSAVVRSVDVGARSEVAGFAFVLCLEAATTGPSDGCCGWGVSAPVDCGLLGFRCLCGLGGAAVTAEAVAVVLGCSVCATDVGAVAYNWCGGDLSAAPSASPALPSALG